MNFGSEVFCEEALPSQKIITVLRHLGGKLGNVAAEVAEWLSLLLLGPFTITG